VLSVALTTRTMREANLYHSVFKGVLANSLTPEQDLRELGVPTEFAVLAGTSIFDPNLPVDIKSTAFRAAFFERLNHIHVAVFYLARPARLWKRLQAAAPRSHTLRPPGLGNFEKQSGAAYGAQAQRWSWWSEFKQRHAPKSLWFLLGYWLALGALIAAWPRMTATTREFYGALWLMLPLALATPVLGEGEADLEKHLFLFNAFFDLSLLLLSGLLLGACYRHAFTSRLDNRLEQS
jgi:hypothetical protein